MIKINTKEAGKEFFVIPTHKLLAFLNLGVESSTIESIRVQHCPYNVQKKNIDEFINRAKKNPKNTYRISRAFIPADELAPMFALAPFNCVFPRQWKDILGAEEDRRYWFG
jgi:hypothetical protein